ncbi:hypothetical protein C2134_08440 [Chromobacterium sinusclupearum]|uniref:Uncharacterized protein n=1 Tax=Chromobacterium sinusclupearum TaxID=2077146 RepID=A0A2K4MPR7_9NEIS|nr:hypothetical protein [Chromobacterium sinusclupearum]POA99096.1 hypothetical protein C2134_08440 [Chromobacterium sinusclupearum]
MKRSAALPIMLICLGCVWLLKSTALLPNTTTLLALLLFAAGVLLLALDGFNKSTLVSSPLLAYAGGAIYAIDQLGLRTSHFVALGMVLAGVLMLLARSDRIPERREPPRRFPRQPD